jgi:hypothetical protein
MSTKSKNIKSSSKTAVKATKASVLKKSTKKSSRKKVAVAKIENALVFAEALTAPVESQEVAVQVESMQVATSTNTDILSGTAPEVQTELPFVEATPTPTPALEVDCGNECTCSTTDAAPKKNRTKFILIVSGVIILIALGLYRVLSS